jgi:hypothetical protein
MQDGWLHESLAAFGFEYDFTCHIRASNDAHDHSNTATTQLRQQDKTTLAISVLHDM